MAEILVSVDSLIDGGVCPEGLMAFMVAKDYPYCGNPQEYINTLDKGHHKLHMNASGLSGYNVIGESIYASDNGITGQGNGTSSTAHGVSDQSSMRKWSGNDYGITNGGDGYSYCSKYKRIKFTIKRVLR